MGWYAHSLVAPLRYARERRRAGSDEFARRARQLIDAICYVGQLSYFVGDVHKSLALSLRGLALIRHAGFCAESACIAGAGAFMSGIFGFDPLSRRLARRALELARESHSPLARAHALELTSLYRVTRGDWAGTDDDLAESAALYRALGHPRWQLEASSIRGKALYLQGRLDEARHAFETMDGEARRSGNALGRHWSTLGLVECGLRSGDMPPAAALGHLGEVRRFAAAVEICDPGEIIREHGLTALFLVRAGRRQAARDATRLAAALIERTRLCGFWALEGYSGAIETALALADEDGCGIDDDATRAEAALLARRMSHRFDRLARHYPILRPRAAWAAALVDAKRRGSDADAARLGNASRLADRWHVGLDRMLLAHA